MGVLMKMGKSRAIKKIARNLPPFLVSGFGGAETFSSGQVERAMEETGCDSYFIDYAYAMFCDESTFRENCSSDYETVHGEVADLCFSGNSNFSFSDAASFSGDSGNDSGGGDGGGD